ncbi:hypothetical protein WA158_000242 [Blastocystis sp. Blastoise]
MNSNNNNQYNIFPSATGYPQQVVYANPLPVATQTQVPIMANNNLQGKLPYAYDPNSVATNQYIQSASQPAIPYYVQAPQPTMIQGPPASLTQTVQLPLSPITNSQVIQISQPTANHTHDLIEKQKKEIIKLSHSIYCAGIFGNILTIGLLFLTINLFPLNLLLLLPLYGFCESITGAKSLKTYSLKIGNVILTILDVLFCFLLIVLGFNVEMEVPNEMFFFLLGTLLCFILFSTTATIKSSRLVRCINEYSGNIDDVKRFL